jgi:hypothetical protein
MNKNRHLVFPIAVRAPDIDDAVSRQFRNDEVNLRGGGVVGVNQQSDVLPRGNWRIHNRKNVP